MRRSRRHFMKELKEAIKTLWKLYYEHPAITSEEYAYGLYASWNDGKPNQVFPFLLKQADQGDLDKAKEKYADEYYAEFRQAIDEAPKPVPPAGIKTLSLR